MALSTAPSTKLVPRDALTDAFRVMPPLALTLCILNVIPAWIVLHAGIRSVLGWWYMLLFCCIIAAGEWTYFTDQTRADPSVLSNLATILLPAMASCLLREAWARWVPNNRHNEDADFGLMDSLVRTHIVRITGCLLVFPFSLLTTAYVGLVSDTTNHGSNWELAIAGESMILLTAVFHFVYTVVDLLNLKYKIGSFPARKRTKAYALFLVLTVMTFFVVVRVGAAVVYFSTRRQDWDPVSGDSGLKMLFVVLPEEFAILVAIKGWYLATDWPFCGAPWTRRPAPQSLMSADGVADDLAFQSLQRNEERIEGAGISAPNQNQGQGENSERSGHGQPGFPAERISRTGGGATPGQPQARGPSEGTWADEVGTGTRATGSGDEEPRVHPGNA